MALAVYYTISGINTAEFGRVRLIITICHDHEVEFLDEYKTISSEVRHYNSHFAATERQLLSTVFNRPSS